MQRIRSTRTLKAGFALLCVLSMTRCTDFGSEAPQETVSQVIVAPTPEATPVASPQPTPKLEPIAMMTEYRPQVTFRRKEELNWEDVRSGLEFFAQDAVQTGKGANASISLYNGSTLKLDEGTMVILASDFAGDHQRDKAIVRNGSLNGSTKRELWVMTSAALFRIKARNPNKPARAKVAFKSNNKLRVEITDGEGVLLKQIESKTVEHRIESVTVLPGTPVEVTLPTMAKFAPAQNEPLAWADETKVEAIVEKHLETHPSPQPAISIRKPASRRRLELYIDKPENYSIVSTSALTLEGRVSDASVGVRVNGETIPVKKNLKFSAPLTLQEGANSILVHLVPDVGEPVFEKWTVIRKAK